MRKKIEVPFTNELRIWLKKIGYTNIFDQGVDETDEELPYTLIPLRVADISDYQKKQQEKILDLDFHEVIDMANGDPFVRFVLQIPINEFEEYLKL